MSSAKQEARNDPASRVLEVKVSPEGLRNTAHGRARPCIISDSADLVRPVCISADSPPNMSVPLYTCEGHLSLEITVLPVHRYGS